MIFTKIDLLRTFFTKKRILIPFFMLPTITVSTSGLADPLTSSSYNTQTFSDIQYVSHKNGLVQSLFGNLGFIDHNLNSNTSSAEVIKNWIYNNNLIKIEHEDELSLLRSTKTPIGWHYLFEQKINGISVSGSMVSVQINKYNEVISYSSSYLPHDPIEFSKDFLRVTKEEAREIAVKDLTSKHPTVSILNRSIDLSKQIVVIDKQPFISWEVTIYTNMGSWRYYIDAITKNILKDPCDINIYQDGNGSVFYPVSAVVATKNNQLTDRHDSNFAVPRNAYKKVTLPNLEGNGYLDGIYASSKSTINRAFNQNNEFFYKRNDVGFSEVMAYYYLDYAQGYIHDLGFQNVNNRQQVFSVNTLTDDNSYYIPSNKEISYGTGGVDDAEDAEVIWHEYGHSILDNQVPGFGASNEARAIGEGFGDYLAGTLGATISGGFQDECVADWDAVSYSSDSPPCLRRLDSYKHYPEDMEGESHSDGEIWSAVLWEIRQSLGGPKTDLAILQGYFLISNNATFSQAGNAIITSAINLGYRDYEIAVFQDAFYSRGFDVAIE